MTEANLKSHSNGWMILTMRDNVIEVLASQINFMIWWKRQNK